MFNNWKDFLELKLNDGRSYSGTSGNWLADCGCIKGNFNLLLNGHRSYVDNVSAKVVTILTVGERMLVSGYPEKAKYWTYTRLSKLDDSEIIGDLEAYSDLRGTHIRYFTPLVNKVKTRIVNKEIVNV